MLERMRKLNLNQKLLKSIILACWLFIVMELILDYCSSGTYIRSIANEIGENTGVWCDGYSFKKRQNWQFLSG